MRGRVRWGSKRKRNRFRHISVMTLLKDHYNTLTRSQPYVAATHLAYRNNPPFRAKIRILIYQGPTRPYNVGNVS